MFSSEGGSHRQWVDRGQSCAGWPVSAMAGMCSEIRDDPGPFIDSSV